MNNNELIKVYKIIEQLENTSSSNDKIRIMRTNKDNELFKKVLVYTYDSNKKYGISNKVLENIINRKTIGKCKYNDLFMLLDVLAANNINDNLRREINLFYNNLESEELKYLFKRMALKDLRCNISIKSINKAINGLIHEHSIMLASKFEGVLKGSVAVTTKMDGIRVSCLVENGVCKWLTRQGKEVLGLNELSQQILKLTKGNVFIDGEILALNREGLSSDDLFRKTTKIVNSKEKNKTGLRFVTFDITSLEDYYKSKNNVRYVDRRLQLEKLINTNKQELIDIVELHEVTSDVNEIYRILDKVVSLNQEGLMLNYLDKYYEYKRSKSILKVKKFSDCDVRVLDIIEGTGKNVGKLGSITIQFEHEGELYTCNVGSGFSDEERVKYFKNKELLLNKIVTIGYFEISKNKNDDKLSMRFPTWKGRIREDKKEISMN